MQKPNSQEPDRNTAGESRREAFAASRAGSRRRRGATALEYLFMISLILIVAISAIGSFGQSTKNTTEAASNALKNATNK